MIKNNRINSRIDNKNIIYIKKTVILSSGHSNLVRSLETVIIMFLLFRIMAKNTKYLHENRLAQLK